MVLDYKLLDRCDKVYNYNKLSYLNYFDINADINSYRGY